MDERLPDCVALAVSAFTQLGQEIAELMMIRHHAQCYGDISSYCQVADNFKLLKKGIENYNSI